MESFSRQKDICYCEINVAQNSFVDFFVAQKSIFRVFTKIFIFLVHRFSLVQTLFYRTSTPLEGRAYDLDKIICKFKKIQEVNGVVGSLRNVVQL